MKPRTNASPSRRPRRLLLLAGLPLALAGALTVGVAASGDAAPVTAKGVRVSASSSVATVAAGTRLSVSAKVRSTTARTVVVDVELFGPDGTRVRQRAWAAARLSAGTTRTFTTTYTPPATGPIGTYRVKVGVFTDGWGSLLVWNDDAAAFTVTPGPTPTVTPTPPPTVTATPSATATASASPTATTSPTATATATSSAPTASGVPARFGLVPPGGTLPSGAQCAAWVRGVPAPAEVKGDNRTANATTGTPIPGATGLQARVDGAFTGTTEQVLRWAACKWGQDEDVVKAQAAVESWWHMSTKGDWGTDPGRCPPGHGLGADGTAGSCPESWGLLQIRYPYNVPAFLDALRSSAFNADYAYAAWRSCYVGELTWLNTVERGSEYAAGDAWGCAGVWFSGRWHTAAAEGYITKVKGYLDQRIWTTASFAQP